MNILFVADIFGRPGRESLLRWLPGFKDERAVDFVIANGENAANGAGITSKIAKQLLAGGVDVVTTGNHVWRQREVYSFLATDERIIRPANYPPGAPGRGLTVRPAADGSEVAVINLAGELFLQTPASRRSASSTAWSRRPSSSPRRSSSTCTPRRPARRSPWGTTWTGA